MPYGYVDPVKRVHQQQALRNLAQPNRVPQGSAVQPLQPVQSPLANLPQAQNQIIYGNRPRQHNLEAAIFWAAIGALAGILIHRNWHRAWVRGVVTGLGAFVVTWIVSFTGACIVSACVKPGDQADLGAILGWTALSGLAIAVLAARAAVRHRPRTQSGSVTRPHWKSYPPAGAPDLAPHAHITRTRGPLAGPRRYRDE